MTLSLAKRIASVRKVHHKLLAIDDAMIVRPQLQLHHPSTTTKIPNAGQPYPNLPNTRVGRSMRLQAAPRANFLRTEIGHMIGTSDACGPT